MPLLTPEQLADIFLQTPNRITAPQAETPKSPVTLLAGWLKGSFENITGLKEDPRSLKQARRELEGLGMDKHIIDILSYNFSTIVRDVMQASIAETIFKSNPGEPFLVANFDWNTKYHMGVKILDSSSELPKANDIMKALEQNMRPIAISMFTEGGREDPLFLTVAQLPQETLAPRP
jgi:hypothetical protein